jgi:serine/threonine protein kinase/Leucine-rich repeat (LRR) protein
MNERDLFLAALELENPAAHTDYLQAACAGDAALLARVEALLASHEGQSQFLNTPVVEQITDFRGAATVVMGDGSTLDDDPEASDVPFHGRAAMKANPFDDEDETPLGYLEPSSKPGSLGRLAHYEVLEVVGRGAFGTVLRALDEKLQRVVAIKVMAPQLASTSPARKRFIREARASAQVRHENVVSVYAVEEKPLPYLVMEYIPGLTLQQRLDHQGPLDIPSVLKLGRQIAEGLAAAHAQDLIHRDIKPGNILLESGLQDRVKITDFGLARAADDASMTQSGIIAGTPMYMAPEQALGHKLDQRADLFSLGSVLYQMATGRPPFRANNTLAVLKRVAEDTPRDIREIIPETPQWLCDIIAKLHAKNPDERFQSAREVVEVLADCEAQLQQPARLQTFNRILQPAPASPPAKKKWLAVAVAVVLLPVLALLATELTGVTNLLSPQQAAQLPAIPTSPVADVAPDADGFVQLFNGQDLTGWKFQPDHPGHWEVKNGILKGSKRQSHLFSERGDYRNFHLRAEVKINQGGDSGILFRAPLDLMLGRPGGCYEAELQHNRRIAVARPTGSISDTSSETPPKILGRALDGSLSEPDEWFTYEVIAEDNHFITKINGVEAANCYDAQDRHATGHIAMQVWHVNTLVQFRKIEIKELPSTPPLSSGFVQLFNGRDLAAWKPNTNWKVVDGVLTSVALGASSNLESERDDFEDFHLRVEARINRGGNSGIFFRSPRGEFNPDLYEVEITGEDNATVNTGGLWHLGNKNIDAGVPPQPNEWFTMEVRAIGEELVVTVNGRETARWADPVWKYKQGAIDLQQNGDTIVQFRKIEIKELSASSLPPTLTAADVERIAALPAAQQVEEVRKELKRLNPKFDGSLTPTIENDVVTELSLNTDEVTNIAPVRAHTKLVYFDCRGTYPNKGKLSDLSPLTGMSISRLDCSSTQVSDLAPLSDLPLTFLHFNHNPVSDLAPLQGMPLEELGIAETKVSDLSPLKGMKIRVLGAQLLPVTDLSPLKGMPLTGLDLYHTIGVTNLEALKGMPLQDLNLQDVPISDLSPLAGMTTLRTLLLQQCKVSDLSPLAGLKLTDIILSDEQITDLSPLAGMPLVRLIIHGTGVRDLTPLQGMPLQELRLNPKNITEGWEVLRELKSLTTISIDDRQTWLAAEFWERFERGEFAK